MDSRIYEDLSPVLKRARIVFLCAAVLFGGVLLFYWKLQILDYKSFWAQAESNRTRDIAIPAPRAVLTDRSGDVILAESAASFCLRRLSRNPASRRAWRSLRSRPSYCPICSRRACTASRTRSRAA